MQKKNRGEKVHISIDNVKAKTRMLELTAGILDGNNGLKQVYTAADCFWHIVIQTSSKTFFSRAKSKICSKKSTEYIFMI